MTRADLERLLAEFIERRDRGESLDVDGFADEHPECRDALHEALLDLRGTDALLPSGDDLMPDRIGAWRVVGPLSRGGMGRVLRVVRDGDEGPERALKLLADAGLAHPRARTRLQREGDALMRLDHKGIVTCHEVGFVGDLPFLVMDLVKGPNLAELVQAARDRSGTGPRCARLQLPGDDDAFYRVARLVADVARSVGALHAEDLTHRDIKPANVVLDETTGRPVLLDFGLVGGDELATLTQSGDVLGTPAYMSPEQARGEHVTATADVFGLGGLLFELLCLEPPRRGTGSRGVLAEIRTHTLRDPDRLDRSIPKSLARIAMKAMSWHHRYRYQTVDEFAEDLDAFASGRAPRARGKSVQQSAGELWQFRRPWILGAAAVLLVLAVVFATRTGPDPERIASAVAGVLDSFIEGDDSLPGNVTTLRDLAPDHAVAEVFGHVVLTDEPTGLPPHRSALFDGARWLRARSPSQAVAPLSRALALLPNDPSAMLLLGWAAHMTQDPPRARRELTSAVRLLPNSRAAHWLLAATLVRVREFDEADQVLTRGFAIGSPSPSLIMTRARLRREQKRYLEGLADVEQALALAGERRTRAQLNMKGVLLDQLDRRAEANVAFVELLRRFPDYKGALFNRARVLDADCRLDEARELYEQAARVDPGYTDALLNLAWLHSGSDRENCEKCRAAFESKPRLLDADRAEKCVLGAVRAGGGRSSRDLSLAVKIAKRLGRRAGLRKLVEELRAHSDISDRQLGRLTRALERLGK